MPDLSNAELALEDVPRPDADLSEIFDFALTFDGYEVLGGFDACAEIANAKRHSTLTELRTCLFFEQRRHHHFGEPPNKKEEKYIRSLVTKLRKKIDEGKLD